MTHIVLEEQVRLYSLYLFGFAPPPNTRVEVVDADCADSLKGMIGCDVGESSAVDEDTSTQKTTRTTRS